MGFNEDTIFFPRRVDAPASARRNVDDSGCSGFSPLAIDAASDPKFIDATARVVGFRDGDGATLRYLGKVPIRWEASPKPVTLPLPGTKRSTTLVLGRLQATAAAEAVSPGSRQKKRELVVALWPYANGWVDHMRFRGTGGPARGRPDKGLDVDPGASPDALLFAALERIDKLAYDYYLTDDEYAAAGKFLLDTFVPASNAVQFYRSDVNGSPPRWVFGLVDDFDSALAKLQEHVTEIWKVAEHPPLPPDRKQWSRKEIDILHEERVAVADRAMRFALAGPSSPADEERIMQSRDGRVLAYAKVIAGRLAPRFVAARIGDEREILLDDERMENFDGPEEWPSDDVDHEGDEA